MTDTCSEQHVPRQVIDNKLLVALNEEGKVAIVLSAAELAQLIRYVSHAPDSRELWRLIADLKQLQTAAFGGDGEAY